MITYKIQNHKCLLKILYILKNENLKSLSACIKNLKIIQTFTCLLSFKKLGVCKLKKIKYTRSMELH